ncbi:FAD-dependent oxidoreductase [Kribbella speibonae]|uniref:FAD-dependent oxidoreductase n=2 Tax=Kribbella speibonae TaxID=1572660 RepID=A0A4R0JHJ0_9ACTN|nr:FAD-dependent oxidoreductase [Kribbella speibonae]
MKYLLIISNQADTTVRMRLALEGLQYHRTAPAAEPAGPTDADVVVYGATSGGVTAAVRAARSGLRVVLLAFDDRVGGMTASGLGETDVGDAQTIGGLAREFYSDVAAAYHAPDPHWKVEAHVAEEIFLRRLADAGVVLHRRRHLLDVTKTGNRITELRTDDGSSYRGQVYVDASYEGDLLAAAGVSYTVGRESSGVYGESIAGVQHSINHQFERPVDPYVVPGQPSSGLLPGISAEPYGAIGSGDRHVQAYNFRLHVTNGPHRIPFPRPDGYDASRYELLRRYLEAGIYELYGRTTRVHGRVFDMNNHGAFSSDHIGASDEWPEAGYPRREEIFQDHVRYQAGLLYYLSTSADVPADVRAATRAFGLAPGEFRKTSYWPHQLYVREGRRMVAEHVVTEHEATGRTVVPDPIAVASYVMDSHNARRVLVDGNPRNEGNVQVPLVRPFGISFRSIVPRISECANLLVAAAVSASHVAFASVRMEPVFMTVGEAAGCAASLAVSARIAVQDVEYDVLRRDLTGAGGIVGWPRGEAA